MRTTVSLLNPTLQVEKQYENLLEVLRLGQVSAAAAAAAAAAGGGTGAGSGADASSAATAAAAAAAAAAANATGAGFTLTGTLADASALGGTSADPDALAENTANLEDQLSELQLCISDSTRTVARLLRQNPLLVRRLRDLAHQRATHSLMFSHVFARLRTLARSRLGETADEEKQVKAQLAALQLQEDEERQRFSSLSDLLEKNRAVYTHSLATKDNTIADLRSEIANITSHAVAERASLAHNLKDSASAAKEEYDAAEFSLRAESLALAQRLESEGGDHFRTEIQKQRQKDLRSADVTSKIEAYDAAMTDKHTRLVELMQVYEKESRELKRLNLFFQQRDEETARVDRELELVAEARDREVKVERLRNENSLFVHDLLGSYQGRKAKEEALAARIAQLKKEGKLKGTMQQQMAQFKELEKAAKKKKKGGKK